MTKFKKRLQGFLKTKHFQNRQQEREVTDQHILRAFREGMIKEVDGQYRVIFEHLNIILDFDNDTLITVHPGDPARNKPKILSKVDAKEIKALIAQRVSVVSKTEDEADDFLKFVSDHKIKKLKS